MYWNLHFLWTDILSNVLSWICSHFYEIHPYLFVYTLYKRSKKVFFNLCLLFCSLYMNIPWPLNPFRTMYLVSCIKVFVTDLKFKFNFYVGWFFLFSIFWFILLKVNTFTKPIAYSKDWFISEMIFFLFTIYIGIFIQSINIFL